MGRSEWCAAFLPHEPRIIGSYVRSQKNEGFIIRMRTMNPSHPDPQCSYAADT